VVHEAKEQWENALSVEWQQMEFRKYCGQDQGEPAAGAPVPYKDFYLHPYTAGTRVPVFGLQEDDGIKTYDGFSFTRMADDGRSLTLAKTAADGATETVTISARLYKTMIDNAERMLKQKEVSKEVLQRYDKMIAQDAAETRPNTAANFWHNYKILCREQASNPQEAMDVAKAIVRQMPEREQVKFRQNIRAYERATRRLVNNPLLQPFVKPQETYNQRILTYYEQNVADLPIKNRTVHGADALATIRRGVESFEEPGKPVDPLHRLKIGDTVKISLDCRTLFGEQRKRLPITEYTVTAFSTDLNKVVLIDKNGHSKYTLAKDAFVEKMQKLEKKLERKQVKQDRYESIRY
jgi:hypothetical protein